MNSAHASTFFLQELANASVMNKAEEYNRYFIFYFFKIYLSENIELIRYKKLSESDFAFYFNMEYVSGFPVNNPNIFVRMKFVLVHPVNARP